MSLGMHIEESVIKIRRIAAKEMGREFPLSVDEALRGILRSVAEYRYATVQNELQAENARLLQRAARAELLVRLLQCGEVIFNRVTETVFTATEELPYDHTTWTDEQWKRLDQLERGGE